MQYHAIPSLARAGQQNCLQKQESICQIPIKKKELLSYQFASNFKEFIAIIYIFTLTKNGGAFFAGGSVSP